MSDNENVYQDKRTRRLQGRKSTIKPANVLRFANEGMGATVMGKQLGVTRQGLQDCERGWDNDRKGTKI